MKELKVVSDAPNGLMKGFCQNEKGGRSEWIVVRIDEEYTGPYTYVLVAWHTTMMEHRVFETLAFAKSPEDALQQLREFFAVSDDPAEVGG